MESKIKEIERLVTEIMHDYPNGCHDMSCDKCFINNISDSAIRNFLCKKMYDDISK